MPTAIAATTPPAPPTWPDGTRLYNEGTGTREMEFRELWEDKARGLRFADVIDIVNPLQHIPVVSTVYRAITGDEIGLGARLIGGALFGGGVGFAAAVVQSAVEEASGKDIGGHLLAMAGFGTEEEPAPAAARAVASVEDAAAAASVEPPAGPAAVLSTAPAAAAAPEKARSPLPAADRMAANGEAAGAARGFPAHPAHSVTPSQNERIMAAVEAARRAQAGILFANAAAELPAAGSGDESGDKSARDDEPARNAPPPALAMAAASGHPNAPPKGASPQWIGKAMEQALNKYEETLRLRNGASR